MELGISSLGNIVDYGLIMKHKDITSLYYQSTKDCLNYAEEKGINIVEIVIDPHELSKKLEESHKKALSKIFQSLNQELNYEFN